MAKSRVCPVCGKTFTVAERNTARTTRDEDDTVYCGQRCKKKAANRRYYQQHREKIIKRVLRNQKK